jgi:hypothetical protein
LTAWRVSRTGLCDGAHHHRADAPPNDGASRRAKDLEAELTASRSFASVLLALGSA